MKRLLVAECSGILAGAAKHVLCARYEVHICNTGRDTIMCLNELRPDTLIIGLSLIDMDGLSVLCKAQYVPPLTLALTCYMDSHVSISQSTTGLAAFRIPSQFIS